MKINMQTMNHIELGRYGEELSREYLIKTGYSIWGTNIRTPLGELDIVAFKDGVLAIIEVKTRRTKSYGLPCEAVSWQKQKHIKGALQWYLQEETRAYETMRFDVIEVYVEAKGINVRHLKDCF